MDTKLKNLPYKFKLFSLLFVFILSLDARENPFVATQAFLDEKAAIIEEKENNLNNKILLDYKPFPFISIDIYNNKIKINTQSNNLFRHFKIENEDKIVLDFKKSNKFLTKTKLIDHKNISQIIIGDHPEEDFFRVVIIMKTKLNKYNIEINKLSLLINNFN